jgi:hypothetical protein
MKKKRAFVLIAFTLTVGFAIASWSAAQTNSPAKRPLTGNSNPALDRLMALESYLEANHDTNALRLFDEYANASIATANAAELGLKLHALKALREGRTNDAINLLETSIDGNIMSFATSYKEMPKSQQEWLGLSALSQARWYRDKYPRKDEHDIVKKYFEILDEKDGK